jgi:hypothetical protein
MSLTLAEIEAEYLAALADAGIQSSAARLYLAKAMGSEHVGAVWHPPGDELVVDDQFPDPSQLVDANAAEHRNLHRIVVPAEPTDKITFAALLRHELEHARAYEVLGPLITRLQHFIEREVLPHKAGSLDGCGGQLVNSIPTEIDCNAAAAVYVSARFTGEEVDALRGGDRRQLACSHLPPEPAETLPARMLAFAFVHRSAVAAYANARGVKVADLLDGYFGDGATWIWARLEAGLSVS